MSEQTNVLIFIGIIVLVIGQFAWLKFFSWKVKIMKRLSKELNLSYKYIDWKGATYIVRGDYMGHAVSIFNSARGGSVQHVIIDNTEILRLESIKSVENQVELIKHAINSFIDKSND